MRYLPVLMLGLISLPALAQSPPPYTVATSSTPPYSVAVASPPSSPSRPPSSPPMTPRSSTRLSPVPPEKPLVFSTSWNDIVHMSGSWTGQGPTAQAQREPWTPTEQPRSVATSLSSRIALDRFFPSGSRIKAPLTFGWEQNTMTRRTNILESLSARAISDRRAFSASTQIALAPLSSLQLSFRKSTDANGDQMSALRRTTHLSGSMNHTWNAPAQIGSLATGGKLAIELGGTASCDWIDAQRGAERRISQKGRAGVTLRPLNGLSLRYSLDIVRLNARIGSTQSISSPDYAHAFAATLAIPERRGFTTAFSLSGDLSEVRNTRQNATDRNIRSEAKIDLSMDPAKWNQHLSFFTAKFSSSISDQSRTLGASSGWSTVAYEASRLAGFLGLASKPSEAGATTLFRHAVAGEIRTTPALLSSYTAMYGHDGNNANSQSLVKIQSRLDFRALPGQSNASSLSGSLQYAKDRNLFCSSSTTSSSLSAQTQWTPRFRSAVQVDASRSVLEIASTTSELTSIALSISGGGDIDISLPALSAHTLRVAGTGSLSSNLSWNSSAGSPKESHLLKMGMNCPTSIGVDLSASSTYSWSRADQSRARPSSQWEGQLAGKVAF